MRVSLTFKALINDGIDVDDDLKLLDDLGGLHAGRGSAWAAHLVRELLRGGRVTHRAPLHASPTACGRSTLKARMSHAYVIGGCSGCGPTAEPFS